jgi:hypothetical protein
MTAQAPRIDRRAKKQEHWISSTWRPMMGWMYMAVCIFDFMLAPVLWSVIQAIAHGSVQTQWQPLTLQGAGLFHVAMGAVLGLSSYGRTQEKMAGIDNSLPNFGPGVGTSYVMPPAAVASANPDPVPAPTSAPTPAPTPAPTATSAQSSFSLDIQLSSKGKKIVPQDPPEEQ